MSNEKIERPRIREVDFVKGVACLLMLAAHLKAGKILPVYTFAAPLFFACSGMNTILLIEKTAKNKAYDFFHVLFPLILFFGGSIQVAIVHGGRFRIIPEFLQFIALAVLLVFLLAKILPGARACGYLFPLPFLVQQLLPLSFLSSCNRFPLAFFFGNSFALFPWLGFVLFGIYLLGLRRNLLPWLQVALAVAFVLSFTAGRIPLHKFWMSLSYILLALLVITLAFSLGRAIVERAFFKGLTEFFSLSGRNALMFVFLHYFVMQFFASRVFISPAWLWLLFAALHLFFVCSVGLLVYEKVKNEMSLFFPFLAVFAVLAGLRWAHLLKAKTNLRVVDMIIGVIFAFLYVQLRRRFAARFGSKKPAGEMMLIPEK